jgi:hypothetical protein
VFDTTRINRESRAEIVAGIDYQVCLTHGLTQFCAQQALLQWGDL